jgi:hypothetical protein
MIPVVVSTVVESSVEDEDEVICVALVPPPEVCIKQKIRCAVT